MLGAQRIRPWCVRYSSGYPLFGGAVQFPSRVGTIMGSWMIKETHLGPMERRWWPWVWGRAHALDFSHVLNMFVPTIFCILWYIFLLNVAIYAFTFSFQLLQPPGHRSKPDPRWGQGNGRLTLCGSREAIWTQVGEMMNGGIVNGRGVVYVDKGTGPHNQSRGFPSITTLKPNGQ